MLRRARFYTVLHLCGFLIIIYSLSMLVPALMGLLYGESDLYAFLKTFAGAFSCGLLLWGGTSRFRGDLKTRDGFLVVVLFWCVFSSVSALPFWFDQRLQLSVTDALFEGISGITTTGASILDNIDDQPKSILYYRAQLNFLGGLGIIVLAIAILPMLGIGGAKLYQGELPGPLKEERLTPRLADTAKHLWMIYSGLALAGTLAFRLAGMDWFDALCHSLSTVSLGGFSTHGDSLGYYHSDAIECVAGVFSILAAVNFALYFVVLRRRSLLPILRDAEFRFFALIVTLVVGYTCFSLYHSGLFNGREALVHGFFQAVSVMTDNGLGSAGFPDWSQDTVLLLFGASFFGGCVGSTCGGIKALRFLILRRQSSHEIRQLIHPGAVYVAKVGGRAISERVIKSVWGLFFLYIFFTCLFTWALVVAGNDVMTAFGTVAACINNMGIGYGATAAGFGGLNDVSKWLMCAAMLFGRLEIFPLIVVFSRTFWRY
ncbi:potassium transporter TrkG [Pokkaliibacter plantistimulans]|uniref:Trk system potassium uptake protein n=1 Tax=Proteobacteria bacterium 228 TaxID=2083153 RepID=A0A2S5KRI8_9PROT|nr:TrkH family potassium uptake protein [Pokkaliibacter plantistimulans]PPC77340.1 potassium transporter TrkG [Pokkaliibacter plantistimulans]